MALNGKAEPRNNNMPLTKTKKGWKFGEHGKVYGGPLGREKAAKQGRAIRASQSRQKKIA